MFGGGHIAGLSVVAWWLMVNDAFSRWLLMVVDGGPSPVLAGG